jgi:hypothetical protein
LEAEPEPEPEHEPLSAASCSVENIFEEQPAALSASAFASAAAPQQVSCTLFTCEPLELKKIYSLKISKNEIIILKN